MSYVLNKVLNTDVVGIINTQVINNTIISLKEQVKAFQALYDCMVKKCKNLEDLYEHYKTENKQLIAKYEISIDDIVETYFNNEEILCWSINGGHYDCEDGLTYNLDKYYQDFENWYIRAKKDFLNWVVRDEYENFTSIPNTWVYDAMKYEIEEFGDLEIYQKKLKEGNDEFIKYVLFIKLQIYLDDNENDNFKEDMKSFHTEILEEDEVTEYD